jgi:hypothetical protein
LKFQYFVRIDQKIQEKLNALTNQISIIHKESQLLKNNPDLNKLNQNLSNQAEVLINLIMLTNLKIRLAKRYEEFTSSGR